jgi:hypothetical protein
MQIDIESGSKKRREEKTKKKERQKKKRGAREMKIEISKKNCETA